MTQSGHGYVTLDWGDGSHTFRLAWGGWKEIDEKCKCGPAEMLDRLMSRRWRADDVYEVIRLGLIGGGVAPVDALALVRRYVHERPLMENVPVALDIVTSSLFGPTEDTEKPGEQKVAREPGTGSSLSPHSTETVQ